MITTIEQLEYELKQKTDELNESLAIQDLLCDRLKCNANSINEIECQLKELEITLNSSNQCVANLIEENATLRLSNDSWTKRAIALEFKLLNACDTKK